MRARPVWMAVVVCGLALGTKMGVAQADGSMTLDVVVTDKAERPVTDLKPEDFKVLDNKQGRAISSVRLVRDGDEKTDPPVTAYLLVDKVNTNYETVPNDKIIEEYLRQAGPRLAVPTSLIYLGNSTLRFQREPTRDPKVLLANIASIEGPQTSILAGSGVGQMADMREKSLEALNHIAMKLRDVKGRKLVIWISPGWLSFGGAAHLKSTKELNDLFSYIVGISTALREAQVTISSVNPYGAAPVYTIINDSEYKVYLKGVESVKQVDNGELLLGTIAAQTGGRVLYSSNNTSAMIDQCLSDSNAFYEVTYSAPHAGHANEYHAVEVTVDKPGMTTRERMGYYAQP